MACAGVEMYPAIDRMVPLPASGVVDFEVSRDLDCSPISRLPMGK